MSRQTVWRGGVRVRLMGRWPTIAQPARGSPSAAQHGRSGAAIHDAGAVGCWPRIPDSRHVPAPLSYLKVINVLRRATSVPTLGTVAATCLLIRHQVHIDAVQHVRAGAPAVAAETLVPQPQRRMTVAPPERSPVPSKSPSAARSCSAGPKSRSDHAAKRARLAGPERRVTGNCRCHQTGRRRRVASRRNPYGSRRA